MKKINRYIYIYFPFLLGIILFLFNIINLFSSLCLFLGGYIAIKNTFDYRVVRKNNNIIINSNKKCNKNNDLVINSRKTKTRKRERVRVRKK